MRIGLLASSLMVALAVSPAACKKDKKEKLAEPAPEAKQPPTDTPPTDPATPPGGHGSGTGGGGGAGGGQEMVNKMMHCPSAAPGAETKVEQTKDAVVVMITAKDAAMVGEIQKRAKHLAGLSATTGPDVKHSGQGTGGSALGKCPVVIAEATVKVEDQKTGVKVTMTPKDAKKLGELAKTATDRAASMAAGGAEPAAKDDKADDEADEE